MCLMMFSRYVWHAVHVRVCILKLNMVGSGLGEYIMMMMMMFVAVRMADGLLGKVETLRSVKVNLWWQNGNSYTSGA